MAVDIYSGFDLQSRIKTKIAASSICAHHATSVRTEPWQSNNDEDVDEYEDCCETDGARYTSSMHVCISRRSHGTVHIMSTRFPVHLIGYTDLFYFT